jgi:hypothetical protein
MAARFGTRAPRAGRTGVAPVARGTVRQLEWPTNLVPMRSAQVRSGKERRVTAERRPANAVHRAQNCAIKLAHIRPPPPPGGRALLAQHFGGTPPYSNSCSQRALLSSELMVEFLVRMHGCNYPNKQRLRLQRSCSCCCWPPHRCRCCAPCRAASCVLHHSLLKNSCRRAPNLCCIFWQMYWQRRQQHPQPAAAPTTSTHKLHPSPAPNNLECC